MSHNVELVKRSFEAISAWDIEGLLRLWDVLEPGGNRYEDLGDRVVVMGSCRVRGRASGAETNRACALVIGVRDGLVVSHRAFSTYEEAEKMGGERAGWAPPPGPRSPARSRPDRARSS